MTTECWILRAPNNAPLMILVNSPSQEWRAAHLTNGCWLDHITTKVSDAEIIDELAAALRAVEPLFAKYLALLQCSYGGNFQAETVISARTADKKMRQALARIRT